MEAEMRESNEPAQRKFSYLFVDPRSASQIATIGASISLTLLWTLLARASIDGEGLLKTNGAAEADGKYCVAFCLYF